MAEIDFDTINLDNQIVASEGKLPYDEDGKRVWKWKRWANLKKFIGVKVPIVDEHPVDSNGKGTLISTDTKIWGYATFKACPKSKKILCASMELDDDAPKKRGYSNGYVYAEDQLKKGEDGDYAQEIHRMDHVALTNNMRLAIAKRKVGVAGDTSENNEVNKYWIGYDSFSFQPIVDNRSDESVNIMSADKEKLLLAELDSIKAENKKLKGQKAAKVKAEYDALTVQFQTLQSEIDSRNAEFEALKTENDAFKEEENLRVKAGLDSKITALKKMGVKEEALKGKTLEHIEGRLVQANFDAKRKSNVLIQDPNKTETDNRKFRSTADYIYGGAEKGFIPK